MASSMNDKNEDLNETLICTICNRPLNDSQTISCGHIFCRQCITQKLEEDYVLCPICRQPASINNLPEIDQTVLRKTDNLPMESNEDEQRTLHNDNIHDPVISAMLLFEPFRFLLSDLINQNRQLKEETNQLKEYNQIQLAEQLRMNQELESINNQREKQTQLQYQTLVEQYDLCIKQFNDQSKKNEQFQNEINQLKEKNFKHETHLNQLQTDDQNQNITIQQINRNFESLKPIVKYLPDTRWKQFAITIAGENGKGNQLNQLCVPRSICIDNDQTLFIADSWNHRIVEWKSNATTGRIVAGGNGQGDQTNQLNRPTGVIIDQENHSLIIADKRNRRVMQWSRLNPTEHGEILLSDIDCYGLTMDKKGSLYVSDCVKNEVKRWKRGEKEGTIVAGGNGKGNHLNQLSYPTSIFADEDESLYVSDTGNHRVMKWMKDAKEGMVVAGGNGQGQSLRQLSFPMGVIADSLGQIYVADWVNDRVMRWCRGAKEGTIVVGGNGRGERSNQLNNPIGLSFDRQGNLYVADCGNHRIQKFEIG